MKKRYFIYPLIILSGILIANIAVNYFVSLTAFPFSRVVGDTNTWVLFNSSVIGSIIGGLVAGIIAYIISKEQIEKENKYNLSYRKLELKYSLQVEVSRKILEVIYNLLTHHYSEAEYTKSIYVTIKEYRKYCINRGRVIDAINSLEHIKEFCHLNYNMLYKETIDDFDNQSALTQLYTSYTMVILKDKVLFDEILNKLFSLKDIKINIKELFDKLIKIIDLETDIEDANYGLLDDLFNEFIKKVNILLYDLECFNVDIQNSLEFLFEVRIQKPEYKDLV